MKAKKLVVTGLALAAVVAIASQSSARMWGNDNHGSMMGRGMTNGTMMGGSGHGSEHGRMMNGGMMGRGMMSGSGMMNGNGYTTGNLTTEQQTAVNNIEEKYSTELAEKESAIRSLSTELQTAQSSDSTTVGEIKTLSNELSVLEQDYWTLRTTVNEEISTTIGTNFSGHMGWDSSNCNVHNDHQGMNGGTPHMYSQRGSMAGSGYNNCMTALRSW